MTHIYRPTQCHTCGEPLSEVWERLEPLSGLLVSELTCGSCGDGYIGTRVPPAGASAKGHEMNAIETETRPTPAAAHHEERFEQIPLYRLVESAHNPRTHSVAEPLGLDVPRLRRVYEQHIPAPAPVKGTKGGKR